MFDSQEFPDEILEQKRKNVKEKIEKNSFPPHEIATAGEAVIEDWRLPEA
jgi:hypothetical protein